jgi:nucleoside-diphosphate-sugar epimerase
VLIAELMGVDVKIRVDEERLRPERSEVNRLVSDSSTLWRAASWKPEHSLTDGLATTIKWFTDPDNLRHYKTDQYNV